MRESTQRGAEAKQRAGTAEGEDEVRRKGTQNINLSARIGGNRRNTITNDSEELLKYVFTGNAHFFSSLFGASSDFVLGRDLMDAKIGEDTIQIGCRRQRREEGTQRVSPE